MMADVQQIDLQERVVVTDRATFAYDFLVIATGSTPQFRGISGAAQHTFSPDCLSYSQ